jgi:hypothetical protein
MSLAMISKSPLHQEAFLRAAKEPAEQAHQPAGILNEWRDLEDDTFECAE